MAEKDQPEIRHFGSFFDPTLGLTADLVAAYVSSNPLPAGELPGLIRAVRAVLAEGVASSADTKPIREHEIINKPSAAEVNKSVTPDALISFIDGRPYKTLKRHLNSHGLDARGYRERYGLPHDYPMVSPNYSAARSELAKAAGLGQPGRMAPPTPGYADPSLAA